MKFRELRAEEIEVRVATVTEKGCSLLLYKNARCDMNILDETVGQMNWQRDHKEVKGNMYAGIGIWDEVKQMWIWKWDCGTESYAESQKGEASDSFKRAGFNWGIGRELYTAPFIWFSAEKMNMSTNPSGKKTTYDTFKLEEIEYENSKISYLKISNNKTKFNFIFGKSNANAVVCINDDEEKKLAELVKKANVNEKKLLNQYSVDCFKHLTKMQYTILLQKLESVVVH